MMSSIKHIGDALQHLLHDKSLVILSKNINVTLFQASRSQKSGSQGESAGHVGPQGSFFGMAGSAQSGNSGVCG